MGSAFGDLIHTAAQALRVAPTPVPSGEMRLSASCDGVPRTSLVSMIGSSHQLQYASRSARIEVQLSQIETR